MYREKSNKGKVCYCPNCHQFGKPAPGAAVEGKTKSGVPKIICTACAGSAKPKKTKYQPGQGVLFPAS